MAQGNGGIIGPPNTVSQAYNKDKVTAFTGSGTFKLDVFYDYDTTAYKSIYLQSDPSLWDESTSQWDSTYWDFPDINKVLIPLIGRGKVVKFSFTATHRAGLSISYYGVKYVKSGFRGND